MIFLLWNKHVYLQKVNQEYFIWNNYSLIITETIIIQIKLLYSLNMQFKQKKSQSSITNKIIIFLYFRTMPNFKVWKPDLVPLRADGGCLLQWTPKTFQAFLALPFQPRKTHDFFGILWLPDRCHCTVNKAQDCLRKKVKDRPVIVMLLWRNPSLIFCFSLFKFQLRCRQTFMAKLLTLENRAL